MLYLLVFIVLAIGAFYLLRNKLQISSTDIDVMCCGFLGLGAIKSLAHLLVGLFTGAAGVLLAAYLVSILIEGGLAYYFFRRSGL